MQPERDIGGNEVSVQPSLTSNSEDIEAGVARGDRQQVTGDSFEANSGYNWYLQALAWVDLWHVKFGVLLVWAIITMTGLGVSMPFLMERGFSMPPVEGMLSYEADMQYKHYFPLLEVDNAILIQSTDHKPFMQSVPRSTCTLVSAWNGGVLELTCANESALGGGCITKEDLRLQAEAIARSEIKGFGIDLTEEQMTQLLQEQLAPALAMMPGVKECFEAPDVNLMAELETLALRFEQKLNTTLPECTSSVLSLWSIPAQHLETFLSIPFDGDSIQVEVKTVLPPGSFWSLFQDNLISRGLDFALMDAQILACNGESVPEFGPVNADAVEALQNVAASASSHFEITVSSRHQILTAMQTGMETTMLFSSCTIPMGFLIVAVVVENWRLVISTAVNIAASSTSAFLIMYNVAKFIEVSLFVPSFMTAVMLALSIDYSLFLLSRFQKEIRAGRNVKDSIAIMMATSGRIVSVSGMTILICFACMLVLPSDFLRTMGLGAAVSVLMALLAALTLTPTLLLAFPDFFGTESPRCVAFLQRCSCREASNSVGEERPSATSADEPRVASSEAVRQTEAPAEAQDHTVEGKRSWKWMCCQELGWWRFGKLLQKCPCAIVVLLIAVAVPLVVVSLPRFSYNVETTAAMPTNAPETLAIHEIGHIFGYGTMFPLRILVVPPTGATQEEANRTQWLLASCNALKEIARTVNTIPNVPPFTANAFVGQMILDGTCISGSSMGSSFVQWSNVDKNFSATWVYISYRVDPYSEEGQSWIARLRSAVQEHSEVATWFIIGDPAVQMDYADSAFGRFPMMLIIALSVVVVVMAIAFRSLLAPIRALLCMVWMLAITFAVTICFVQLQTGSMFFMVPIICLPVLIGLGLDYDVFYTERVIEECLRGHTQRDAALIALAATANIISAAGAVMVLAFLPLIACNTPVLKQIGFILTVGVLIDCFLSTKVVIPVAVFLMGKASFWPRKLP